MVVVVFNTFWFTFVSLVLRPCLGYRRQSMASLMGFKQYLPRFQDYMTSKGLALKDYEDVVDSDYLDDISVLFNSVSWSPNQFHRMSPEEPISCTMRMKNFPKRRHLLPNAYHIGEFELKMNTRKEYGNWDRTVLADCSFLVGLSDFKQRKLDASRPNQLLLSWYKLKTSCRISNIINGLEDGTGEADILVGPLRMLVRAPKTSTDEFGFPEMHMSEARDARVTIRDFRSFPSDSLKDVSDELKKAVLCIVNSDVRNVLMDSMKCLRNGSDVSCRVASGRRSL